MGGEKNYKNFSEDTKSPFKKCWANMHKVSYHKAELTLRKIKDKIQSNYKLDPKNYSLKKNEVID